MRGAARSMNFRADTVSDAAATVNLSTGRARDGRKRVTFEFRLEFEFELNFFT